MDTKGAKFPVDPQDVIGLGVPLWYITSVKKNQIRMMKDRGYSERKQDEIYLTLSKDNIAQHLLTIKPNTFKLDMSGVYKLSEKKPSIVKSKSLGEYMYVHYPEFILNKNGTEIKQEGTDLVRDIVMRLDVKDSTDSKGNIVINADQSIYKDIFSEFVTNSKEGLKGKNRWVFDKKNTLVQNVLDENKRTPIIRRIIIVSYAGISNNAIKELKKELVYYFEIFKYKNMSHIPIDHIRSPKYRVLTEEEWSIIASKLKITKEQIPKRYLKDPITKYFGAVVGEVFQIKHKNMIPSSTLTHRWQNVNYRVVTRDPEDPNYL